MRRGRGHHDQDEELGGAVCHTSKSGVADLAFENDVEALMIVRRLMGFIPGRNRQLARLV